MLVVDGEGVFREVLFGEELKEKHTFFSEKRHCFSYQLLPFKEKFFTHGTNGRRNQRKRTRCAGQLVGCLHLGGILGFRD